MRFIAILIVALVLSFIGALCNGNAQTHPEVSVPVYSGPFGTGTNALTSALGDISRKFHPWLRINNTESFGLLFNQKKLDENPQNKRTMVITSGSAVTWLAQNGMKPFDKKYSPVQFLANQVLVSVWLATRNPRIKTANDLIGKKIALGRAAQVNWGLEAEWLIRYGWGIRDKVTIQFMGPNEAAGALMDGLVDAAVAGGYLDPVKMAVSVSPQVLELIASGNKIYFIPWGEEAVKKTIAKGLPITPLTIPANTFKGLGNENESLAVFTDDGNWAVALEFPEEIAYEFTKLLISNIGKFPEYGSLGKLISSQTLTFGLDPKKIHPGAVKAYKEAGILK